MESSKEVISKQSYSKGKYVMNFLSGCSQAIEHINIYINWQVWIKLFVISWWSLMIGSYLWLLSFVPKFPLVDGWIGMVASVILGGAGMNHITNLYNVPTKDFHLSFAWPAFIMTLAGICLVFGVLLGALYKEAWTQIVSAPIILASIFFIILGADTAPSPWSKTNK